VEGNKRMGMQAEEGKQGNERGVRGRSALLALGMDPLPPCSLLNTDRN